MSRSSARIEDIGEADGWRCWLCDGEVDPALSVNDDLGPSVDTRVTAKKAKAKKSKGGAAVVPRLAHRACNTGKGGVSPVVEWSDELFVIDPAPIIPCVDRLVRKGGREAIARCPTRDDAEQAAAWFIDRVSRLEPGLDLAADIEPGGGQFLLIVRV